MGVPWLRLLLSCGYFYFYTLIKECILDKSQQCHENKTQCVQVTTTLYANNPADNYNKISSCHFIDFDLLHLHQSPADFPLECH